MKQVPYVDMSFLTYYRNVKSDLIGLRTKIFNQYGHIARHKLRGHLNYYIADPNYAQRILQDNQDNYLLKHPLMGEVFSPFTGKNGLFINNNLPEWYRDRQVASMGFEPQIYFSDYAKTITRLGNTMFEGWLKNYKNGDYFNAQEAFNILVVNITSETLFTHIKMDAPYLTKIIQIIVELIKKKMYTIPPFIWNLRPAKHQYQSFVNIIQTIFSDNVINRLADEHKWDDILGYFFIEYKDTPKEEMIKLLSFQLTTLFAVSFFTTSSLLQWLMIELSLHPDIERRVSEEVNAVIGSRLPEYKDMTALPYLTLVIKETLRLHPTNFAIMRQAIEEDTLGDYLIPKHAGMIISTYHIHRDPELWSNPEDFNPERFNNNPLGQNHPYGYIPFGGGKRKCIGSSFSTLEAILIVSMIVQKFRLHLPPHSVIKPHITTVTTMCPNISQMQLQIKS